MLISLQFTEYFLNASDILFQFPLHALEIGVLARDALTTPNGSVEEQQWNLGVLSSLYSSV